MWSKHYTFPCCPKKTETNTLDAYLQKLKVDNVFAYNDDSPKLLIRKFVSIMNNSSILVLCEREDRMCEREGFRPWVIIKITLQKGNFFHSKLDSYFEKNEADKAFCINQGLEWTDGETFDYLY